MFKSSLTRLRMGGAPMPRLLLCRVVVEAWTRRPVQLFTQRAPFARAGVFYEQYILRITADDHSVPGLYIGTRLTVAEQRRAAVHAFGGHDHGAAGGHN